MKEEVRKITQHRDKLHPRAMYLSSDELEEVEKDRIHQMVEETFMTEIQLRRIVRGLLLLLYQLRYAIRIGW
jgi:hypothetical protein